MLDISSPHLFCLSSSAPNQQQHAAQPLSSCEIRAALYSSPFIRCLRNSQYGYTCVLDVMLVDGGQYFTVSTQLKDPPVTCDTNPRGASRILAKNFRTTVGVQAMHPLCWSAEAQTLQPLLLVIVLLPGELQVFSLLRVIPGPLEGS